MTYFPLSSNTFTGAVGWGASGWKEQFLGMGCRMGADWDWQQQELKPTAQATARIRVVTFIEKTQGSYR